MKCLYRQWSRKPCLFGSSSESIAATLVEIRRETWKLLWWKPVRIMGNGSYALHAQEWQTRSCPFPLSSVLLIAVPLVSPAAICWASVAFHGVFGLLHFHLGPKSAGFFTGAAGHSEDAAIYSVLGGWNCFVCLHVDVSTYETLVHFIGLRVQRLIGCLLGCLS